MVSCIFAFCRTVKLIFPSPLVFLDNDMWGLTCVTSSWGRVKFKLFLCLRDQRPRAPEGWHMSKKESFVELSPSEFGGRFVIAASPSLSWLIQPWIFLVKMIAPGSGPCLGWDKRDVHGTRWEEALTLRFMQVSDIMTQAEWAGGRWGLRGVASKTIGSSLDLWWNYSLLLIFYKVRQRNFKNQKTSYRRWKLAFII